MKSQEKNTSTGCIYVYYYKLLVTMSGNAGCIAVSHCLNPDLNKADDRHKGHHEPGPSHRKVRISVSGLDRCRRYE